MVAPKAAPKASQGKKQQSIASFFTPKSTQATQKPQQTNSAATNAQDGSDDDGDDDIRAPVRRNASASKRALTEDADRGNTGLERPAKRAKGNADDDEEDDEESLFVASNFNHQPSASAKGKSNAKSSKGPPRTSKYLFNGSSQNAGRPAAEEGENNDDDDDDDSVRKQKELLHRKFVQKLGHPDSIAQIKRRNFEISEETAQLDEEGGEDDDERPAPAPTKKKGAKTGKLTPMEIQFLDIKRKHMDAILIVEVGYKFKFFGEDARVAAKELSIVCIPGKFRYDEHPSEAHLDRFASASIPVHRLPVHAKRLVAAGHKVGVVRQIETAALKKAGDNRNTPFIRKLTNLYTKGTYIDDIEGLDQPDAPSGGAPATGYLLCITETKAKGWGTDEKVDVGILAVQPGTGDVIYDNFEDGFMRSEIETRLLHISPCEFLIVGELTKATEKLVQHLSGSSTNVFGDKIRVERVEKPKTTAASSYSHVAQFYAGKMKAHSNTEDDRAANLLDKVLKLSEPVTICLSAMIKHMTEYGLEHVFDLTKYFQSFSARSHMMLNGNTLTSLEVYRNSTDSSEHGSLFWALDKTQTKFGQRLLRKWVGRPLIDRVRLEERLAAVTEIKDNPSHSLIERLKSLLSKTKSDLERSLLRIYYGKCTRPELLTVLQTMQRITTEFAHLSGSDTAGFESPLLNAMFTALPTIGPAIISFLDKINAEAARADDKYAFFHEDYESDAITNHKLGIASVEHDLEEHRPIAASTLKKKNVQYVTVAGIEYLIEVSPSDINRVPASWMKISGTKKCSRFHTPEVVKLIRERDQHKESLAAACDLAFAEMLAEIAGHYSQFRDIVTSLATLDCLLSLAQVASQPGYVKPEFSEHPEILIEDGRHPMIEQLLQDSYIPNSTRLSNAPLRHNDNGNGGSHPRALLITGPNMGGKSSYIRQTALLVLMAQLGSYLPCESATLGLFDSIHTRMGASDNIMKGESTFMVELSETSEILKKASERSLVILDELGRGTSTHDGVAIAGSVLEYVIRERKGLCLFVTHYQVLAKMEKMFKQGELRNVHMGFASHKVGEGSAEDDEEITFLYTVEPGVSHRSYGLNVARLAHIPQSVLALAGVKSRELEEEGRRKKMASLGHLVGMLLEPSAVYAEAMSMEEQLEMLRRGVEEL